MTPLIWAAAAGHLEIVKFLVENGANLHAQTCDGYTPLHYANANGHWEVAKFLRNKLCP